MNNKIDGGAFSWARQTIESEIFYKKPDKWFKIWFYLVSKAKWKDGKQFKRGQCFMKYEWITEATGANRNQIDHCIRWLKSATQIATAKATRGFILTICNYNTYQNLENYKSDTKSDSKSDLKATQKRHRSDTILKKGKKENKEKNVNIKEINKEDFPFFKDTGFTQLFNDYLDMRKNKGKKFIPTDRAKELVIIKLHKYDIRTAVTMLERSIVNNWTDVYEEKSNNKLSKLQQSLKRISEFGGNDE